MANCNDYISADDLKTGKQAILHIEHVAKSRDANGNHVLDVTDIIRGQSVTNKTLDGLENLYNQAISQVGYITMDSFEDGATLTLPNQVLRHEATGEYYRWDGGFPKTVSAGSTPESAGGIGLGAWVSVGDASLRNNLASYDGFKIIGMCPDIATLRNIEPTTDGQRITLKQHTMGTGLGGGQFRAVISGSTYIDNNGTIIKTTGGAAWLRVNADIINPLMFGAVPDGVTDCSAAFTNALSAGSIHIPDGNFVVSGVQVPNNTSIRGNGYKSKIIVQPGTTAFTLGNETAFNNNDTVNFYDGCHVENLHLYSTTNSVADTIGIRTVGLSSSVIKNISYTKLFCVIKQDHAEGCTFSNISNSDLEDNSADCRFVIFANITKRSNDNIYEKCIARAIDTEIYLGKDSAASSNAQHDGVTIKDNILFPTTNNDNLYIANCIHSSITNNLLFVPARNGIRIEYAMINTNVTGNEVAWAGRFISGGADAILIQTVAGSAATAYGQCDISGNVISMPSGNGFRITGLGQFNLHGNTIVSPNNIKSTVTGAFIAKNYDAIRIGSACNRFNVSDNLVTTGRHGQGGDDFTTNWRWDIYVESGAAFGNIRHDGVNVRNLSPSTTWHKNTIQVMSKQFNFQKEVMSPYTTTGWASTVGTVGISVVSVTNPYEEEATNIAIQFAFPGTFGATVRRGEVGTTLSGSLGATMMIRTSGVTSANISITLGENGGTTITRNIMINDDWAEIDLRKEGTIAATYSTIAFTCSETATVQIAELRVTPTKKATRTSGNHYYGTAAPTSGFWKAGDVVQNSAPASGSPKSWVCTTSGIPGVWVSQGNL